MTKIIEDHELGTITLKKNTRANNYIIRIKKGSIYVTIPYNGSYKRAVELAYSNKELLIRKIEKSKESQLSAKEEKELRDKAKELLPDKLRQLASLHGFRYTSVRITKSRTRWGSCSSKATINLSLNLMRLPAHLIEYVLLHELCHTIHMNHGHEFWLLLNNITGNQAHLLKRELKKHRII